MLSVTQPTVAKLGGVPVSGLVLVPPPKAASGTVSGTSQAVAAKPHSSPKEWTGRVT